MKERKPRGPRRPSKPKAWGASSSVPMSRSHGQELARAGSELSFKSKVSRQRYWAERLQATAREQEYETANDDAALGVFALHDETEFATANIHEATLRAPDPNQGPYEPGMGAIPGLDAATGAIPPPPPRP